MECLRGPVGIPAEFFLRRGHRVGDAPAEIRIALDHTTGLITSEVAGLEHAPGVRGEIAHGSE